MKKMKKISILLIICGTIILVSIFKCSYFKNEEDTKYMNEYIENTSYKVDEIIDDVPKKEESNIKKDVGIHYTAILEIPKINLKSGVVDNTKNFYSINYAISVDNSSNYPNENGNFILYAHSGRNYNAYFTNLDKLVIGDNVFVYYNGIKYNYIIKEKKEIPKTGSAKVYRSKDDKYITLITCTENKDGYQIVLVGKLENSNVY